MAGPAGSDAAGRPAVGGHPGFLREDADLQRPPRELGDRVDSAGRGAMAALVLVLVATLVSLVFTLLEIDLLGRIVEGETVSDRAIDASDTRVTVTNLVVLLTYLAGMITFIFWFHRAYVAVGALTPSARRYGTGWAIGGWFVPILAFWRPKQIANDLWRATAPPGKESVWPLTVWWIAFLIFSFAIQISADQYGVGETPSEIRDGSILAAWSSVISLIGVLLALMVVRTLTRRLTGRLDALPSAAPGGGGVDLVKRA